MAIEIREITDKSGLKRFVQFQNDLYKDNKYFVPTLISDDINTLSKDINPAFEFCESVYYMAYKDGKPVGRIAGMINNKVNNRVEKKIARFGFVDFIDDAEVVDALFAAVGKWGKTKGMNLLNGPLGFTDLDPEGMLIEGYDQLGTMATIYNHPYYVSHMKRMGFEKEADWVEYKIFIPESVPEKHKRISEIVAKKHNLRILKYTDRKKVIADYGVKLFELINEAYDSLYGYSPLSKRQIDYYINMYLPMLRLENLVIIVDNKDDLIAMGVGMPSLSKALQKSNGKLFPLGFAHLLKALKGKNDVVDLLLIAVKPEYQNKGVNALLFYDLIPVFNKNGYKYAESNPELELNEKVQNQWQYFETEQHKRRRAYIKTI